MLKSPESIEKSVPINYELLADELDLMQAKENSGRGISCVVTMIEYLRAGDAEHARAVCFNEGDKISSYPEIQRFVVANLFAGQDKHPWSVFGIK